MTYEYAEADSTEKIQSLSRKGFRIVGISPDGYCHMQKSIPDTDYQEMLVSINLEKVLTYKPQTLERIHEKLGDRGDITKTSTGRAKVLKALVESEDVLFEDGKYTLPVDKNFSEDTPKYDGIIYG